MNQRFPFFWALVGSVFTTQVLAHAIVTPTEGRSGARHQFFSVVAPTEKDIPVVEMKIEIPPEWKTAGGQFNRVQRDPLWDITVDRDEDDWIRSITWSGSEAPDYSFVKFDLIVSLPRLVGMQQFKIWQTYADGSVVAWVEDRTVAGVKKPAAGLMLTEADACSDQAGNGAGWWILVILSGLLGGLIGAAVTHITGQRKNRAAD